MKILLVGDIVGKPGVEFCVRTLPGLRRRESIDVIIANGENADAGSGITQSLYKRLKNNAGVDCITLGDHAYRKREIFETLDSQSDIIRPANFPNSAPGRGLMVGKFFGQPVAIINLIGRVFMKPVDCPFLKADQLLEQLDENIKIRIIDFHAEATSDKQVMGRYLDGRVSAVLGTHTHVATADEQILPGGTAFQCDVGMTGSFESILGRVIENVVSTTISLVPSTFHVAERDVQLSGTIVEIDETTGLASSIRRVRIDEENACDLDDFN
ncbi:MAG TPA: TIGR00282 family metallophosphoesterase [Pirellulaceae bacterium]|nr:TIGR00282 family metallophosphoesterase [Pirellulaceae bacterium]HMO92282.1 TIGR00282 family metallophosphoesterase [Pirellulaceae bacterium]HMP70100.1 TIGR00282 family metallophosphoesterase [Pirellulaceae bacterium]